MLVAAPHTALTVRPVICTAVQIHACILSPQTCRFITLPQYSRAAREEDEKWEADDGSDAVSSSPPSCSPLSSYDPATTLVLYPSPSAVPLSDPSIAHLLPNIDTVVVIESTWQKGGAVYSHPALALTRLQAVRLSAYESTYWRYQELGRHALCTLEAMYHLCSELIAIEQQRGGTQRRDAMRGTQLDDLLYLYAAQHARLQRRYQQHDTQQQDEDALSATADCPASEEQAMPTSKRQTRKKPPPRAWQPM